MTCGLLRFVLLCFILFCAACHDCAVLIDCLACILARVPYNACMHQNKSV